MLCLGVHGPHGRGTALRVLAAVPGLGEVASGPEPLVADAVLDLRAGTVTVAGRVVPVVLTVPRQGEVGVVEDLLVDRAFADVEGEATALASLGDLTAATLDELRWQLGAAALARAAGATADAVRDGLQRCPSDPHRHLQVVDGVAWVEDPSADPQGPQAYDRVVWVVRPGVDVRQAAGRLRAVVTDGPPGQEMLQALRRHAPDVPVLAASSSDTEHMTSTGDLSHLLTPARAAARPDDTVLLAVPGLAVPGLVGSLA